MPDARSSASGAMAVRSALAQWQGRGTGHLLGQTFSFARHTKSIDAAVELWSGRVAMSKQELTPKHPVAPIEFTKDLSRLLLGLFGNKDRSSTPEQVDQHEAELKKHGKTYEFHRYE